MSLSIGQLRAQIRSITGQDVNTLPDQDTVVNGQIVTGIDTFLNLAWWQFLNVMPLREAEASTTQILVVGQSSYTAQLPFDAVRMISFADPDTLQQVKIEPKSLKWYRDNYNSDSSLYDKPLFYIRDSEDVSAGNTAKFYIWPTPDRTYTLTIDYWATVADASSGGIITPRETDEIVKYGAAWRVFTDVNGNINKAAFYKSLAENLANNFVPAQAKEERDYSRASVDVPYNNYWDR